MAVLSTQNLTLADWAKRMDPNGNVPEIAELLSQSNEILEDLVLKEGNLPTGHQSTIRTGLPTVYFRSINAGVPSSKSITTQVVDTCGILESYSTIDLAEANLNGNSREYRLSEDVAFLESMNQTQSQILFYGNPATDNRQYLGLSARYGSLSAGNAQNILDSGGTGSTNASVWLVLWGDNTIFCPFPKGSAVGLQSKDLGEQTVLDANMNPFQALRTHYSWNQGLVVKDWRCAVRIANIKITDLVGQSGTQAATASTNVLKLMARSLDRIPNWGMGRPAFYMNRTLASLMRVHALDKSNAALSFTDAISQFGTPMKVTSFMGVPIRKVDKLLNTESQVA